MYVKKIKRKCGVRGCKNTVSYAISKNREMGNSVIACRECLLEALNTIEEQNKPIEAETEGKPIAKEETAADVTEAAEDKPKHTRQRKK